MVAAVHDRAPLTSQVLPVLALHDVTPFPGPPQQATVSDPGALQVIEAVQAQRKRELAILPASADREGSQRAGAEGGPAALAVLHHAVRLPDGSLQVVVRPLRRIRVVEWQQTEPYPTARVELIQDVESGSTEERALASNLARQFREFVEHADLPGPLAAAARELERSAGPLSDLVAASLPGLSADERRQLLGETVVHRRLQALNEHLGRELAVLEMGRQIQSQVQQELGQNQREHFLREQMRAIQRELGTSAQDDLADLRQRLDAARLPPEARREADRELERLAGLPAGAAEGTVARTYLDWLASVPWRKASRDRTDLDRTRRILDADHEGLEKIKERIVEYVAVRKLRGAAGASRSPVLCFVGPPGVGKTSLGRSIARALGRRFQRMSLGGVRDEAEIRGHRRTYIGALPGRLVQALRKAGTANPVILLDEIDKVGADHRGDPSAALLEVLDPEQNAAFVDHYLDVPLDLSRVLFLATANDLGAIPEPLRDRMEIVQLPGYPEEEKIRIARRHLLPRQLRSSGLGRRKVEIADDVLRRLIRGYTREAGLRNFERELGNIARKLARRVVEGGRGPFQIGDADLTALLGPERVQSEAALREDSDVPGLVAGLAWTAAGGQVMFVEASSMPGEGLRLTGQLGEVMKESAQIALSYVRSHAQRWGLAPEFLSGRELHLHLPSGAVPKDGPSAGVTLTVALVSLLTGTPVRADVAMTGEVTLRGRVLPVGGIEEKVLAAHRAGFGTVVLPRRNEADLADLPDAVRSAVEFVLVDDVGQVLDASLAECVAERRAA